MTKAKRVFDEGQALVRRNSASSSSYLRTTSTSRGVVTNQTPIVAASRVDESSSCNVSFFSSSSIAKMLNNLDPGSGGSYSDNGGKGSGSNKKAGSGDKRSSGRKATRSTSSSSMRSRPQRRSSSGSGLSTTSSTMSNGHQPHNHGLRFHGSGGNSNDLMGRASSASSLSSFDDRYDHLYSYSSNLDLFEHQLFKTAQQRSANKLAQQKPGPSNKIEAVNDFDLTAETRLLMDRTNQLVGKKSDREWVI